VQLLTHETPDYIAPSPWPDNSPDLNQVDYQIWGKLQECVYFSWIHAVTQLKSHLIEEWEHFNQMMKQSGGDVSVFKLAFEYVENI